jgi:hypothetical protein
MQGGSTKKLVLQNKIMDIIQNTKLIRIVEKREQCRDLCDISSFILTPIQPISGVMGLR